MKLSQHAIFYTVKAQEDCSNINKVSLMFGEKLTGFDSEKKIHKSGVQKSKKTLKCGMQNLI